MRKSASSSGRRKRDGCSKCGGEEGREAGGRREEETDCVAFVPTGGEERERETQSE